MVSHNGISHFEFTSQIFDVRCLLDAMFLTCASGKGPRQIPDTLERFRLSALVGTHWCYSEESEESYYLDYLIYLDLS